MKAIDIRNASWSSIQASLHHRLAAAYQVWCSYGPGTTRDVSQRSGWDILSLRPRTTDLYKLGLVELVGRRGDGGIYKVRPQSDWESWSQTQSKQMNLI